MIFKMFSIKRILFPLSLRNCSPWLQLRLPFFNSVSPKIHKKAPKDVKPVKLSFNYYERKKPKDVSEDDAPPVIIMHGLFGNKNNWASLGKAIRCETCRPVFSLDARNHGDSPHSDDHTYFHLAEDIKQFMDDQSIKAATLIGHSMGGRAVMAFALLFPERTKSLAVVDIFPIGVPEALNQMKVIFSAMKAIDMNAKGYGLSDYRKFVEKNLAEVLGSKTLGQFLSMNLIEKDKGVFDWKVNIEALVNNYHPHIVEFPPTERTYTGPTIFIVGEKSNFVDMSKVDNVKKIFPESFFVTVKNAGHWVHAEQPQQFLQIINTFIKRSKIN